MATKKDEFQREVSHIHGEFQHAEQKRMDDKMLDVLLIKELKEENKGSKIAIEKLTKGMEELREKIRDNNKLFTKSKVLARQNMTIQNDK